MTNNIFFPRASFVGFDELFNQLERATGHQAPQYPPHNIVRLSDAEYAIELAVAGFTMEDLDIERDKNMLTVTGDSRPRHDNETELQYVHKGISQKRFVRTFNLAEHIEVTGAELNNGILSIKLEHIVPDELKPRKIPISKPELLLEETA